MSLSAAGKGFVTASGIAYTRFGDKPVPWTQEALGPAAAVGISVR